VERIEAGELKSQATKDLLYSHISPMLKEDIDCLVLGCTHYPYLIPLLKEMLPHKVTLIDSGNAVAQQTKVVLAKENLIAVNQTWPTHTFYTNVKSNVLGNFVSGDNVSVHYLDF